MSPRSVIHERILMVYRIIGLFVHTPFPSSEVFRCLPRKMTVNFLVSI